MTKVENREAYLGEIEISPEAVEVIAGIAVAKMKGVNSLQGSFKTGVKDFFDKVTHTKGVILSKNDQGELVIDLYVSLYYGVSIPTLATAIQNRVKEQVLFMCDITIQEVHVHVTHLVNEKDVLQAEKGGKGE